MKPRKAPTGSVETFAFVSLLLLASGVFGVGGCATGLERAGEPSAPAADPGWDITLPRGAARTVDFVTQEGTWMSVDVSPDGRTIALDLLAHIYRVGIRGGTAECLTQDSGIATNFQPRFSRDGRHIAFISDRAGQNNLWIMETDGSHPRLVFPDLLSRHAEPAWSADGQSLFATRFFPNTRGGWTKSAEIWRFPLSGEPPVKLLGTPETQVWCPSPSSDGRFLYYHQATAPIVSADGFYKISDQHHLRRLDLATGWTESVTAPESRLYYRRNPFYEAAPAISGDGRTLAFVRNLPRSSLSVGDQTFDQQAGLWLRDLETGRERLLMHPITPAQFEFHSMFHQNFVPGYAWMPDGKSLVLSQGGKLRQVSVEDGLVSTLPFEARVKRTLSEQNRPQERVELEPFEVKAPRWSATSPDGKVLLFQAAGSLWRKDLPQGTPRRLVELDPERFEMSPAWSPDGREIVFASWSDVDGGHLWHVPAAGGKAERLTRHPGEYLNPVFSPDGTWILALRGAGAMFRGLTVSEDGWFDLVRVPASGGEETVVTRIGPQLGDSQLTRPFFGPEGRIYFTEEWRKPVALAGASRGDGGRPDPEARNVLASVTPEGKDRRNHATFPLSEDVKLSRDGRFIAFHASHNIFLAPFVGDLTPPRHYDHTLDPEIRQVSRSSGRYPEWGPDGILRFLTGNALVEVDPARNVRTTTALGLRVPTDFAQGTLALTGARILTSSDPAVIEEGTIVVTNGRIAAVGRIETGGFQHVLDLKGKTVMPGLVDGHAHNHATSPDLIRPHHPQSAKFLAYGVTTAHDPAARANLTFPIAEMTRAGRILGPRLFSAGLPLYSWGANRHEIRTFDDAVQNVERLASEGAHSIKQYFQINRYQRQWIAEAARRHGNLLVTGEGMDLYYDLSTIMDGQTANEHPVTQVPYYRDLIEFYRRSGTPFSPTLVTPGGGHMLLEYWMARSDLPSDPRELNFSHWRTAFRQKSAVQLPISAYQASLVLSGIRAFHDQGVTIVLGGHGEVQGASSHFDLWLEAQAVPPQDALRIGTIETARHLGLDRDVGSIQVGKLADLIVLNSNPLDDIRNTIDIAYVMKGGRLYESSTLDQVWPEKKPFGPRPWRDDELLKESGVRSDRHFDPH
jgi:imidazolonepropionase-like amidohydrolase/Tol biopolymer transport system component